MMGLKEVSLMSAVDTGYEYCQRGECGWWSEQYAACGIRALANIMAEKNV